MAKRVVIDRSKPNKSEAIRQVLAEQPTAKPKEVAEIVNQRHGHKVTAQYVSVIKSQSKKNKRKASRRLAGRGIAAARSQGRGASASSLNPSAFDAAIGLVEAAGGLEEARAALQRLERLKGKL